MSTFVGILGAALLFALMGFSATRRGTRLEAGHGHGDSCALDSCSIAEECGGCGDDKNASGWWPERT